MPLTSGVRGEQVNLASLRIEGDDRILAALVENLELSVDTQWKKGQSLHSGGTHSTSGFCAVIADAPSLSVLLSQIRTFITRYQEFLDANSPSKLDGELSIGISCGSSDQIVGSVILGAEDLRRLGATDLALSVSAYPTSDDANIGG
jgi:hypothetical protein